MSFCVAIIMIPLFSNAVQAPKIMAKAAEIDVTETTELEVVTYESECATYYAAAPAETTMQEVTVTIIPSGSAIAEEERRKGEEYLAYQEAARLEREEHEALLAEYFTEDDIIMTAQLIHVEAGSVYPICRRAAVAWTVVNRLDNGRWDPTTISGIITQSGQYAWYSGASYTELDYEIARDVLTRWAEEQISGEEDPGRILPKQYDCFYGDGSQNYFYDQYGNYWDFEVGNDPYENW